MTTFPADAPAPLREARERIHARNAGLPTFLQAVDEVFADLAPLVAQQPDLVTHALLDRLAEPERVLTFRVPWTDDAGRVHVQRGYRVQFNGALGPYKGGLRFHPSVTLDTVTFLAFEQTFKNALTGLPLGSGKGGADFDPKGRSDAEVMRFAQSFMTELHRHLGDDVDVPAGDVGVGAREIGYLFGQYKRLAGRFEAGVLTGKPPAWAGLAGRASATGYGLAYFAERMMDARGGTLEGRTCVVSGAGNVARYAARKLAAFGAHVVACSDSTGRVHDPAGLDVDLLDAVKDERREGLAAYADARPGATFTADATVWDVPCDAAFPCATENELDAGDAKALIAHGVTLVAEGANMPCTPGAVDAFREAGVAYGPGKAANAGGVATSGLEMRQNARFETWTEDRTDEGLRDVMAHVHAACTEAARRIGRPGDLAAGANVAGFERVAGAMHDQGVV